jgi:K+-sensing histidine kinase KdpD
MLAGGRLVNEARRHLHYEAMAVDSSRLRRLVKELLNFGRMQTDAMLYRRDWFTAI